MTEMKEVLTSYDGRGLAIGRTAPRRVRKGPEMEEAWPSPAPD
jgi:hypothetical protein